MITTQMPTSLAPAGAPIKLEDLWAGCTAAWAERDPIRQFQTELCEYFGTKHSFLLSSGKAALTIALRALARISKRQEVVIPAFTSFCLPSAVASAGLRIVLCDVTPETLDFDLDALKSLITERTLCVIPVHLFGLSAEVHEIAGMARAQGAYVIEDAAQAAGGRLRNQKLGTIGDLGVFSLGRGKNITTVDGGVIVTGSDMLAAKIRETIGAAGLKQSRVGKPNLALLKAIAFRVFLHPSLYWLPRHLPFLKLGASHFSPHFPIKPFSKFQSGMGISLLQRLDQYNEIRRANACYVLGRLRDLGWLQPPQPLPDSHPVYLRLPLLTSSADIREAAYRTLSQQGLGVSKTYPSALNVIKDLSRYAPNAHLPYPNAERMANTILTLPTHPYVTQEHLDRMVQLLRSLPNASVFGA